jgi:hypothetical protein
MAGSYIPLRRPWAALAALLIACPFSSQAAAQSQPHQEEPASLKTQRIPPGVILPVSLNRGFSTKNARTGQIISARIMQQVPLPGGGKIPPGAEVIGTIVSANPRTANSPATISLRFHQLLIHHHRSEIVTDLRALAGFMEVQAAQIPEFSPGFGTPYIWANTRQIGGDEKYGVGGPVTDENSQLVGEGVYDGVLVHVRAQPEANCRGSLDSSDRLQALWVFSADACGVYGMDGVTIPHAGRSGPLGVIVLESHTGELKLRSATGMLLRVVQ